MVINAVLISGPCDSTLGYDIHIDAYQLSSLCARMPFMIGANAFLRALCSSCSVCLQQFVYVCPFFENFFVDDLVVQWALGSQHGSIPNSEEILVSLQGCHVPTSRVEAWRMIVAWGCLLAFDTLLFLLTAARAIRRSQLPFRLKRYSSYTHLVATIYRDVAIYYFVMVAFNTATLICFFLESDMFRAVMATPTSVVSAILCARLILNIREATSVIFWTQPAYYTPPICLSTNFDPGLSPH
jgi:hypothetical protein